MGHHRLDHVVHAGIEHAGAVPGGRRAARRRGLRHEHVVDAVRLEREQSAHTDRAGPHDQSAATCADTGPLDRVQPHGHRFDQSALFQRDGVGQPVRRSCRHDHVLGESAAGRGHTDRREGGAQVGQP
ncbi:hypothetical protein ACFQ0Q_39945 [Streptomyces aureus]